MDVTSARLVSIFENRSRLHAGCLQVTSHAVRLVSRAFEDIAAASRGRGHASRAALSKRPASSSAPWQDINVVFGVLDSVGVRYTRRQIVELANRAALATIEICDDDESIPDPGDGDGPDGSDDIVFWERKATELEERISSLNDKIEILTRRGTQVARRKTRTRCRLKIMKRELSAATTGNCFYKKGKDATS